MDFEIDGNRFKDFDGFVCEFNRGFIRHVGGDWNGNLDAFHDYLSWADEHCTFRWCHSEKSRIDLGHAATSRWLAERLIHCHPANKALVQNRLDDANKGLGPTLFDTLVEIIQDNDQYVELVLD
ncbi:MAG: barnase inhibitor [Planctomycetota bacterium]